MQCEITDCPYYDTAECSYPNCPTPLDYSNNSWIDWSSTDGFYTRYPTQWNYCPHCGKKLEAEWKYCPLCGRELLYEYSYSWITTTPYYTPSTTWFSATG